MSSKTGSALIVIFAFITLSAIPFLLWGQVSRRSSGDQWRVLLNSGSTSFSAVSSVDYATIFSSTSATYNEYEIKLMNVVLGTSGVELWLRGSDDGSTFEADNGDYKCGSWAIGASGGTLGCGVVGDAQAIKISDNSTSTGGEHIVTRIQVFNPHSTTQTKYLIWDGAGIYTDQSVWYRYAGGGKWTSTAAMTGIRILPESGTMTGNIYIYGIVN